MRACACKSRTFTLAYRMNVNAMHAWRQLRYLYIDANSATGRTDRCSTDLLSFRVDDVRVGGVCRLLRARRCAEHRHCRTHPESSGQDKELTHWNEPPSKLQEPFAGLPAAYSRAHSRVNTLSIWCCRIGYQKVNNPSSDK